MAHNMPIYGPIWSIIKHIWDIYLNIASIEIDWNQTETFRIIERITSEKMRNFMKKS